MNEPKNTDVNSDEKLKILNDETKQIEDFEFRKILDLIVSGDDKEQP